MRVAGQSQMVAMVEKRRYEDMICVDIWGGNDSMEHLARYLLTKDEALQLAGNELEAGFLVNLRSEIAWGLEQNFDLR